MNPSNSEFNIYEFLRERGLKSSLSERDRIIKEREEEKAIIQAHIKKNGTSKRTAKVKEVTCCKCKRTLKKHHMKFEFFRFCELSNKTFFRNYCEDCVEQIKPEVYAILTFRRTW